MAPSIQTKIATLQQQITHWIAIYDNTSTLLETTDNWQDKATALRELQQVLYVWGTSSPTLRTITTTQPTVYADTDLNKTQTRIAGLITAFEQAYSKLNFHAVRTFSIVAGSTDAIAFDTTLKLFPNIWSELNSYKAAIDKQKPVDQITRDNWVATEKEKVRAMGGNIQDAQKLIANSSKFSKNTQTTCASVFVATQGSSSQYQTQLNALDQIQKTRTLTATEQTQYQAAQAAQQKIETYQTELQNLLANEVIDIQVNAGAAISQPLLDGSGKMALLMTTDNAALIAHELQHLIQVKKGQLGLMKNGSGTVSFLYDLEDEVEAYQIQYVIEPNSVPGTELLKNGVGTGKTGKGGAIFIHQFADINTAAIQKMVTQEGIEYYANLPATPHTIADTLSKLNLHPRWKGKKNLKFYLRRAIKGLKIKRVNSFYEELWKHNQNRKLTDKLYCVRYDDKKLPVKDKNKQLIWSDTKITLLALLEQHLNFKTK